MPILALDIGGSKLMASLVEARGDTACGEELHFGEVVYRVMKPRATANDVLAVIDDAVASLGAVDFDAIGVTIPGLADVERGVWVYAPFSGISDFPIASVLSQRFGGRRVAIENDVNACAVAEKRYGVCRGINHFLWVTVSNGIGGGLVLNGELYRGACDAAAEFGHIVVVEDQTEAAKCGCGNRGCLEAEAAGPAIARRYQYHTGFAITAEQVAEAARAGDGVALEVIDDVASLIGRATSYAVNLLNLEAVVFGGGVMGSSDVFLPSIRAVCKRHLFRKPNTSLQILTTAFGNRAGLAGAATVASDQSEHEA
ncbi:MAG: ROK family protein [Thermoguttaceae bacterium]